MDEHKLITEVFDPINVVAEQASGSGVLVPIPSDVLEAIREDDSDPKFATFVIESGFSRSKRLWGPTVFSKVHEQISNPGDEPYVGYLGHIKEMDDDTAFPDIQFQWLASKLQHLGDKARLFTKAYVLPDTRARYYVRRGLAKTVSWRGDAILSPIKGGVEVKDFSLESIDLARPRKAGMSARLVAVTSEMSTNTEGYTVKPEEIAALQENELRAHAPSLVSAIETAAAKPHVEKVSEMETTVGTLKPQADTLGEIRKLLGVDASADPSVILDSFKNALDQIKAAGRTVREGLLDAILGEKMGTGEEGASERKMLKKILVGEMESKVNSGEFQLAGEPEADKQKVMEMFTAYVNADDDLKKIVSEMEGVPANLGNGDKSKEREGGEKSKYEIGQKNDRILVRAAGR